MVTRTWIGSWWRLCLASMAVCLLGGSLRAQDTSDAAKRLAEEEKKFGHLRVKAKDSTGKETPVYEKVVVASPKATIAPAPAKDPKRVAEWSVFFRIKDDDGSDKPVSGWVRVGSSSGKPLGWVKEEYLKVWRTRFLLEIQDPDGNTAFSFKAKINDKEEVVKLANKIPKGYTRLALVANPPANEDGDNTEYPVIVYTGKMADKKGVGQGGSLDELKLEIVFVIESTDFMMRKYGDLPLFDHLKNLMKTLVDDLQQEKALKGAVRLGLVEYRDNVPLASYPNRLACKLTEDPKSFLNEVNGLKAISMNDDWMDDVITGLDLAISKEAGWSENSVKHVILIGASSCQLKKKGEQDQFWKQMGGGENKWTKMSPQVLGYNKSGLSIDELCARAAAAGGADDVKIRLARTLHTVQLGRPEDVHPNDLIAWPGLLDALKKHNDLSDKMQDMTDAQLDAKQAELVKEYGAEDKGRALMIYLMRRRTGNHQAKLAEEQYKQIAKKNNDNQGLFRQVEPSVGGVNTASKELAGALKESFQALKKLREGGSLEGTGAKSELIAPLWKLEKAEGGKVTDLPPATDGTAKVRGDGDKQVALRRVMVTEGELQRLKSTLESLNKRFAGMAAPAQRKNVADVLKELKAALAQTSVGQDFDAGTDLQAVITDLPLRTGALKVSARALSLMSQDAFTNWLSRLEAAQKRIQDLLDAQDKFSYTSQEAVNDKIAYLELSALP